jgi:hypothetical protein
MWVAFDELREATPFLLELTSLGEFIDTLLTMNLDIFSLTAKGMISRG